MEKLELNVSFSHIHVKNFDLKSWFTYFIHSWKKYSKNIFSRLLSVYFVYLQLFQQDQSIIMLEIGFTVSLSEKQQFCKFVSFIQNVKF